jgi:hypothetical protein
MQLSIPKMPSGANTFEISDIHEEKNREPVLTSDQNIAMLRIVTLHRQLATVSIRQRQVAALG